jgi:hypothetical protein
MNIPATCEAEVQRFRTKTGEVDPQFSRQQRRHSGWT